MARAARVRKAPTVREQAKAARSEADSESSKIAKTRAKLPLASVLGIFRPIFRPLRWLVPRYFINSWREVRQVSWPTRRETWRLTLAVFIFAVVFGSLVAGVDKVLDLLFKKVILKQ